MEEKLTEVTQRFAFHPADTEEKQQRHETARVAFREFAGELDDYLPDCREKALALTALQEAMMWSNAAIAYRTEEDEK